MKIRTGTTRGAQGVPEAAWLSPALELAANPQTTAGLPTVASPVGVNATITIPGETGFLASTDDEWAVALKALARSDNLRKRVGRAGRQRCEERYSTRAWLPVLLETLDRVRSGA